MAWLTCRMAPEKGRQRMGQQNGVQRMRAQERERVCKRQTLGSPRRMTALEGKGVGFWVLATGHRVVVFALR